MNVKLILAYDKKRDKDWVPSLGLGYLVSFVREKTNDIEISVDTNINELLKERNIDVVGISCASQNINIAKDYARRIKEETNAVTVLGGPHITVLPSKLPEEFDYGVAGEGEISFLELLEFLENRKGKNIHDIKGIIYREDGKIKINPKREHIQDLDVIPMPNREELEYNLPLVNVMTSRGCPNACLFCCSPRIWGRARYFSVNYTINEIENIIKEYTPGAINFFDDVFFESREKLRNFTEKIEKKRINQKVIFTCYMRAEIVDDEIMALLKRIGIRFIYYGAESGSDRVLKFLKGPKASIEDNQKILDLAKKYKINVGATFIKGTPGETKKDLQKTYDFIKKNVEADKIHIWKIFPILPLPGSVIWQIAKNKKKVNESMDFSKLNFPEKYLYINDKIRKKDYFDICKKNEELLKSLKK